VRDVGWFLQSIRSFLRTSPRVEIKKLGDFLKTLGVFSKVLGDIFENLRHFLRTLGEMGETSGDFSA
jgi:hypothetical protein